VPCSWLQTDPAAMIEEFVDAYILFALKRDSMATEVILRLPDHVYHQAARLAQLMDRNVERVLAETIASALSPLGTCALDLTPVQELSDSDFLAVADLRMRIGNCQRFLPFRWGVMSTNQFPLTTDS
jgi:hypothetical protein